MASRVLALSALLVASTVATAASSAQARPIAEIRQAQIDAASRAHAAALAAYITGTGLLEPVYVWSVRWLQAERAHAAAASDVFAAIVRHRTRMDVLATLAVKRVAVGAAPVADSDAAAYYSAEAELWASGGS
jgi:hypothetical protein